MDHSEAVRLQAAEKYLLGELPKAQREEYEEHYFDCPACAEDLKTTVAFLESSRQLLREEVPEHAGANRFIPAARGFFGWLRPVVVVPLFAILLFFIGYQNSVTIPSLKQASSHLATAEVVKSFSLMSLGARGEGSASLKISVRPQEDFDLDVDMPGNSLSGYVCQIQDESGKVVVTLPVSAQEAKSVVQVNVPGGSLKPGNYNFVIFTGQAMAAQTDRLSAAAKKPFTIEFVQ